MAVIVLATTIAGATASAYAQTQRFRDTEAAQAFAARDFECAVVELDKLRELNPENVLILRFLGITLDQLDRDGDAIDIFSDTLDLRRITSH